MLRIFLIGCLMSFGSQVHATMAVLTPEPKSSTVAMCEQWAAQQDEEAIHMWGILQSGDSSNAVGIGRLTQSCLGEPKPEIVGFGSSVGFNDAYCKKHGKQEICKRELKSRSR